MKAISIHQPWAWAIFHAGKNFENRTWTTNHFQLPPPDAGIHERAESLYKSLQQPGIKNVVFRDAKGLSHEWQTWRYALYDFALREKDLNP